MKIRIGNGLGMKVSCSHLAKVVVVVASVFDLLV
jgi:hypothetical protein